MKAFKKFSLYAIVSMALFTTNSCTKLDENVYDQLLTDNFYNNKNEVLSAVLRPYTHANAWSTPSGQPSWWRYSELSADQLAWPTKGRHGEDGGKWKRLHYHSWTVDESDLNRAWQLMWWGLGLCTDPIMNLESRSIEQMGITQTEKDAYIAELKLLRAFHYLKIMDLWGGIPIVTTIGEPLSPPTMSRTEVFNFIEKEIKENIDKAPVHSAAMTGRMSQAGGYAMLVELYLNAEVWTGTPRWDDCIAAADKIIGGAAGGQNGAMALDANIQDTYVPDNDKVSKEPIFSIAYEYQAGSFQPSFAGEFFHFDQRYIYGGHRNGNDGIVLIPGVWTKYEDEDLRKRGWFLEGPQFRFDNGEPVIATGGNEYNGEQLVFVDNIRKNKQGSTVSNMSEGEENSGVRFNKYKLGNQVAGPGGTPAPHPKYNSTDWHIYRLSWIYFAKAEALMRKNNNAATGEAVAIVNSVKQRAFTAADWPTRAYTTATLTMDELLDERGREFIFEGFRRQDLIRWNKLTTTSWWDHEPSQEFRRLYPIPLQQIALNQNLVQNPGYQ